LREITICWNNILGRGTSKAGKVMELTVEFNDKAKSGVKKSFVFGVIEKTAKESGLEFAPNKKFSMSMAMVNPEEIRRLNKIYRKKDMTTDVLSFSEYKNRKELELAGDKNVFLGELVLCYNEIERYAGEKKLDLKKELINVIAHGTLHLLGFSHGRVMFDIQNKLWTE